MTSRILLNLVALSIGLALAILFFCLLGTSNGEPLQMYFLTLDNFRLIAAQTAIVAIGALGMTMISATGGIDLSAGSVIALSGVVAANLLHGEHSAAVAILAALFAGALAGLVNGTIISAPRVAPFIATLGMLAVAHGISKWIAPDHAISLPPGWIGELMRPVPDHQMIASFHFLRWAYVAPGVLIALCLAGIMTVAMQNTIFGRHVYAIGSNEAVATLCGINVVRLKMLVYTGAGVLFGLAGLLQMPRLQHGDPTTGVGLELDIVAAVLLGGASVNGGRGSITGSVLGAFIVTVLRNGSQQAGWPVSTQEIIVGCVILTAVVLNQWESPPEGCPAAR